MAENTAFVYNRDSIAARNILTSVASDDIGHDIIHCTLAVDVDAANFVEQRMQNGFHRPYMEILGSVSEVFIEDDDDRWFPCGTKRLQMDEPQRVRIAYIPSTAELKDLIDMGLYYPDFKVPHNLVGNTIEIPSDITYTYIYDSIVGMVGINNPYEIETSTKENNYVGIFLDCDVSEERVKEETPEFVYTRGEPVYGVPAYKSVLTDYFEDDLDQRENLAKAPNISEDEDQQTMDKFADILASTDKEIGEKKAAIDATEGKRIRVVAEAEAEAEQKAKNSAAQEKASKDVYTQLLGNGDDDSSSVANKAKLKYDAFKAFMAKYEKSVDAGDGDDGTAKEDLDKSRQVDRALDNQALNNGATDTAGFGATENTSKMTDKQKAQAHEKRARAVARQMDIAADNQALNRGETDIAGQGAGNSTPKKTDEVKRAGADMLRSLLGQKSAAPDQDDSPKYL